jgi:AcrR family transcriptional regulator
MLDLAPALDQRGRILAAAERCFARAGFHRATMQDVAREAGMSPGNLYRYFPSKDAIVAGLCERDQAELAADFAELGGVNDFLMSFRRIARKYLVDDPRERAVLVLEIWAESTRNPAIAAQCRAFEVGVKAGMARVIEAGRAKGEIPADIDVGFVVDMICMLGDGLFKRRVLDEDFNAERDIGSMLAMFVALLNGVVRPTEERL